MVGEGNGRVVEYGELVEQENYSTTRPLDHSTNYGVKLMENRKKKAAAISAVMSYIKTEEEAFSLQPIAAADHAPYSSAPVQLKLWGISGRQAQMQMRNLMQMKAFHRVRRIVR